MKAPNLQQFWADLLVEELIRQGVRQFVLAPGSRSTPLALAVARHPRAEARIHFDERGAAFYALGYARATGRVAPWMTTSGTAVANGLPAVVEASMDHVPMLLLTADRPPELRDAGANQTIHQPGIFGTYTRWQVDVPVPDPAIPPAFVLTTADQALFRSQAFHPGPVHVNLMFREPLAPEERPYALPESPRWQQWERSGRPYTQYTHPVGHPPLHAIEDLAEIMADVRRGLIVVGRMPPYRPLAFSVRRLAEGLGWPLITDVGSQLRLQDMGRTHLPYADLLLASEAFAGEHRPEMILHVGGPFVSRRILQRVAAWQPEYYVAVHASPERLDPAHLVTHTLVADEVVAVEAFLQHLPGSTRTGDWLAAWTEAHGRVESRLKAWMETQTAISEPAVARGITRWAPEEMAFFLASSMPVRDVDAFGAVRPVAVPVEANRGASGIDGLIASAAGFATGLQRPVTLLIGDLAFLHDVNSLALVQTNAHPVIVVVVNNQGGGIFSFLPIARHREHFESYFGTPHPYTFREAAELFQVSYFAPDTLPAFQEVYLQACASGRSAVIEVRTDREENVRVHTFLREMIIRAVEAA